MTPGGGGYGDAFRRDPALVARDVARGYYTPDQARTLFGVAVSADGSVNEVGHGNPAQFAGANMIDLVNVVACEPHVALLPLGRRWPEGPDEGAFLFWIRRRPPHQFGRMTYSYPNHRATAARGEMVAVSHGLTSSPQGERGLRRRA